MTMVFVPAGEFIMGTDRGMTDESPAHPVYLAGFWLDRTEVTNEAYRQCVEAGACEPPSKSREYFDDAAYASHPAVYVSWEDAVDYCVFVGRRLPTEAEWEKAAAWNPSTNEKYIFPWGNEFDCAKGNFDDETELDVSVMVKDVVGCDGYARSAPVGSFPQGISPYGALDMAGNVWEWVYDAFLEVDPLLFKDFKNYYAISPYENPQGVDQASSAYRVMRGGSWNWTWGVGRVTYRLWFGLDDAYDGVGFRCAMSE
jgi:serine/threonine-protein kinase